jgi:hypothetical protein
VHKGPLRRRHYGNGHGWAAKTVPKKRINVQHVPSVTIQKEMLSSILVAIVFSTYSYAVDPGTPTVVLNTPCSMNGKYACGSSNAQQQDSISVCQNGLWNHLDDCNDAGNNKCSLISGIPYCVIGAGGLRSNPVGQNQTPPPRPTIITVPSAGARGNHIPQDCKAANEFLCVTQCGKVLIHCTGVGMGAITEPLDEPQAVCNMGKIDFASNCIP